MATLTLPPFTMPEFIKAIGGKMLLARPLLTLWSAMILAVLTAAIPTALRAQTAADINAANKQVEQLYADRKYAEATPIAEQTLAQAESTLGAEHPDTLTGVKNLADLYYDQDRLAEAEPLFRRALEVRERVLGPEHPDTLMSVNDLGVLAQTQSRYSEAEPLFKRALEARERVLGPEHPDTLASLNELAASFQSQQRYGEAEPLMLRGLDVSERVLGPDHPDTLLCVVRLSALYLAQDRQTEAEPFLKRTVEIQERVMGSEHPSTLVSMNNLADAYRLQDRLSEAAPLYQRVLEVRERNLGRDALETIGSVTNLAVLYKGNGRYGEAEPLFRRALETRERLLGRQHPDTLRDVDELAGLYLTQGRYDEAEPLLQRSLATREQLFGRNDPAAVAAVYSLARLYDTQGRYSAAEPLDLRALEAREHTLGNEHPDTLASMSSLARLFFEQGRYSESELLIRRALEVHERVLGVEHPNTLASVNNLAVLYRIQRRYGEAEPLYLRAVEVFERTRGSEDPATITSVSNLAEDYFQQGRYAEAKPLFERALEANERTFGKEHAYTLASLSNLAGLYGSQGRYSEAEPLNLRAFETSERVLGGEHPNTLLIANNLGELYRIQGRYGEAEPLFQRIVETSERVLGREHPQTLISISNLAEVHFGQRDWTRAAQLWRRSTAAIIQRTRRGAQEVGQSLTGNRRSEAEQLNAQFRWLVKAMRRQIPQGGATEAAASRASFQTAQWALSSEAARSLAQMAARGASGDPSLAGVARERQDLVAEWRTRDGLNNAALGKAPDKRNAAAETENRNRLTVIDARIATIDKRLAAEFPDYAALASPVPLSVEEVQAQLGADEALVLFLDTQAEKPAPEETFIWVVTKMKLLWVRSDLGTAALARDVQALRCGLDEEEWGTVTNARRCGDLLGLADMPDASRPLPFSLGKAHALYKALFGQIEDVIAGKRLLIVPSGALTMLPFQVLVTKKPKIALPKTFEGYRNISWLGRTTAIAILPAVSSLKALRQHAADRQPATDAYAGFGNPLLGGDGASCRLASSPAACPGVGVARRVTALGVIERATVRGNGGSRSASANMDQVFANGSTPVALLGQVRGLCPLADTAYEINCVAERFKGKAPLIRLAGEATETEIKALSKSGQLARYRVLHFATHGLLSGDVEKMAQRQGEPALVLTPPEKPADDGDDGLLMGSEVAALRLNADWVVLSACNTAAGNQIGAQALSGLARAFFYAGGRALLVSHWPVYSDAAVRLTTRAFAELDRDPKAGRAEALQSAMIALMDDPSQTDNAHPAVWAPFVVVGEGGDAPTRRQQRNKK